MNFTPQDKARFYALLGLLLCGTLASKFLDSLSTLATVLPLSKLEEVNFEDANFSSVLSLKLSETSVSTDFTPYRGVEAITSLLHSLIIWAVIIFFVAAMIFLFSNISKPLKEQISSSRLSLTNARKNGLACLIAISCATLSGYLSIASWNNSSWDEVSLFAAQVDSVRNGFLNTVPITGPLANAEASVDTGSIFGAAVISILFDVEPFTAVHVWSALGVALLCLLISALVHLKSGSLRYTILASLAFGPFFVPVIAASAGGFPVAWAAISLVLLLLGAQKTISSQRMIYVSLASLFAFLVRADYVLAGLTATAVCFLYVVIDKSFGFRRDKLLGSLISISVFMLLPIAFITLFRINSYGLVFPSGAIGKSTGLFSDYITAGIRHLDGVNKATQILTMTVVPVVLISLFTKRIEKLIVLAIASPLLLSSIIGGGDWFPSNWARYFVPLFTVAFVASISSFRDSDMDLAHVDKNGKKLITLPTLAFGIIIISNLSTVPAAENFENVVRPQFSTVEFASSWNQRTSCLAQAGKALGIVFPNDVGLATSEINTLSYFSNQSLTDLQGIVDPRVARQPLTPLEHGITFQKRRLKNIIETDQPGMVYVSEPVCISKTLDYPEDQGWQTPDPAENLGGVLDYVKGPYSLGRWGEQYRNGSVAYLVDNYQIARISWGESSYILIAIRNDLEKTARESTYSNGGSVNKVTK